MAETIFIGVDEAGRGPLFGRVYASACVLCAAGAGDDQRAADFGARERLGKPRGERCERLHRPHHGVSIRPREGREDAR